jgi:hypothetical protein
MIFWSTFFLYSIISPLTFRYKKGIYLSAIGIISSADIYGVQIVDFTFIAFTFFIFVQLMALLAFGFNYASTYKLFLNNYFNKYVLAIIIAAAISSVLTKTYFNEANTLLFIRPIILVLQWLVILGFYKKFIYIEKDVAGDVLVVCWSITLFTFVLILYQLYGYTWYLPVNSSTYQLSEIREFGWSARPAGLTREPAHLTVIALAIISAVSSLRPIRHKSIVLVVFAFSMIGFFSETRSIILLSVVSFFYYFLFISKVKLNKKITLLVVSFIIFIFALIYYGRLQSVLDVRSDESTLTRYGLLFVSVYYYLSNPWLFMGLEHAPILFCASGQNFLDLNEICGKFDEAILNSTVSYLVSLPFFINFIVTIFFYLKSDQVSKFFIINFLISGLVLYQWAFPVLGIYFFLASLVTLSNRRKCVTS